MKFQYLIFLEKVREKYHQLSSEFVQGVFKINIKLKGNYCIRPNYVTMCLGFSNLLGKLVVKYNMYPSILRLHLKKDQQRTYVMMLM